MKFTLGAVILAAGEGKRLKLDSPKPLAPCLDKKLIDFPIRELKLFFSKNNLMGKITAVIGHQKEKVKNYIESNYSDLSFAIQTLQLGTGDALKSYFSSNSEFKNFTYTLVMCADTPAITESELSKLLNYLEEKKLDAIAASYIEKNPTGYGRIVKKSKGFEIVEEKEASFEIKKITEVNAGIYIFKTEYVLKYLEDLNSNNNSGEFYLTDVFKENRNVETFCFENESSFMGVNTLFQLEKIEKVLRNRIKENLRDQGVRFIDSSHCYIDSQVEIGSGSTIYPNVFISGKTKIGKNVVIEMGAQVCDSVLEDNVTIFSYSVLKGALVKESASVGPMARLREGSVIGEESKIGNFVEIKKSNLSKGVKVSHLSYVGDAEIGEETNIGCGFITCNYDGVNKHLTKIGKNCFIGSDSQTVAPVEIGDNCFVASSSTITKNMKSGAFAISRGQQITKDDMAHKFIKKNKNH